MGDIGGVRHQLETAHRPNEHEQRHGKQYVSSHMICTVYLVYTQLTVTSEFLKINVKKTVTEIKLEAQFKFSLRIFTFFTGLSLLETNIQNLFCRNIADDAIVNKYLYTNRHLHHFHPQGSCTQIL